VSAEGIDETRYNLSDVFFDGWLDTFIGASLRIAILEWAKRAP
jgi:hypothetical protein